MAVLTALAVGTLGARVAGWLGLDYVDGWPQAIAVGLALMFTMTGIAHFTPGMRRDMIAIVPPRLPRPALLVAVTGCSNSSERLACCTRRPASRQRRACSP